MEDFKGNSHASKSEEKIVPVVTNVTVKKPSEIEKIGKSIVSENIDTVGKKLASDVLIPSIKKLICDIGTNFINWFIYGVKGSPANKTTLGGLNRISYSSMYDKPAASISVGSPKATLFTLDEIYFDDRGDAELVLIKLKERVNRYGMVSVGDFYQMVQQPYVFTAEKYGWRDLASADILRKNDKYLISFPKVVPLE